jgi:hypothetical protein
VAVRTSFSATHSNATIATLTTCSLNKDTRIIKIDLSSDEGNARMQEGNARKNDNEGPLHACYLYENIVDGGGPWLV